MTAVDHTPFIRAICANPADDLPRLVFADFLEDTAELRQPERAEFIRTQIALMSCKWQSDLIEPRGHALVRRELKLINSKAASGWFERFGGQWQVATDTEVKDGMRLGVGTPWLIVRRGFVDEVRCRLADLIGGECERCVNGKQNDCDIGDIFYNEWDCPSCSGTGRIPGIGPAVVAAHPVQVVTLTDRAPYESEGRFGWRCRQPQDVDEPQSLPPDVWQLLGGYFIYGGPERLYRWYPTRERAIAALSAVLILLAKQREGGAACVTT